MDKFFLLFVLTVLLCFQEGTGKKCPSMCTKDLNGCRSKGGKIIGYCTNNLACCDLNYKATGTCGDTKTVNTVDFISPGYPALVLKKELLCTFAIQLLEDTVGVKIEFLDVVMDGLGYAGNGASCDSDMFYFKGFKTWTPPALCGNLTGYTTVIERSPSPETKIDQLHIVALMSSQKYRWKIKLTQIARSKVTKIVNQLPNKYSSHPGTNRPQPQPALADPLQAHQNLDSLDRHSLSSGDRIDGGGLLKLSRVKRNLKIKTKNRLVRLDRSPGSGSTERARSNQRSIFLYPNPDAENIFIGDDQDDADDLSGLEIPMIVNGQDTEIQEVPWQVSIRLKHVPTPFNSSSNSTEDEDENDEDNDVDVDASSHDNLNSNLANKTVVGGQNDTNFTDDDEGNDLMFNNNGTMSLNDSVTSSTMTPITTSPPPSVKKRNCSAEEGSHFCGGTIIGVGNEAVILTAAHCFYGSSKLQGMEPLDSIKIVLGDTDTCTRDLEDDEDEGDDPVSPKPQMMEKNDTTTEMEQNNNNAIDKKEKVRRLPQQEYEIETVVFHYAYDNVALLNDVALVKLKKRIDFNTQVKKIRLAGPEENFEGQTAICSGWGKTNLTNKSAQLPHILQSSQLFIVRNQSECNAENERLFGAPAKNVTRHPKYSHAFQSVLCTSSKNTSRGEVLVGPGDSGGPLVVVDEKNSNETILIGVVSYGIPTAKPKHGGEYVDFFQSVAYFRSWINLAVAATT